MNPQDVRPGMILVHKRSRLTGRAVKSEVVRSAFPCPGSIRGVGKTHINDSLCYDNAAEIDVVRSLSDV